MLWIHYLLGGFHDTEIYGLTPTRSSSEPSSGGGTKTTTNTIFLPPDASGTPTPGPSSSPSAAPSSFTTVPTRGVQLALDCPNLTGVKKTISIHDAVSTYTYQCGVDFSASGQDIIGMAAYTVEDCLRACSKYNQLQGRKDCVGISFNAGETVNSYSF